MANRKRQRARQGVVLASKRSLQNNKHGVVVTTLAGDMEPGKIYYSNYAKVFFLVLENKEKEMGNIVFLKFIELTGKFKGVKSEWHLYSDVSYNFEEVEVNDSKRI